MEHHTSVIVQCGATGGVGLLAAYLLQMVPVDGRIKNVVSAGIAVVTLFAMLRIGGIL